ncbi:ABC1 domain-containing protein [Emericellopsis atlantica]|uniref:ABC1 domain-containing protein n=1 Tax=Emericellopsis atlantica TaxID=2614577 RepID=A0A9P8CQS5_9HYPO|nr:ABC1 domain-containing protein [Emericellopsis atlantica]KAG9255958.1 ABC1 domain-containing protein [Emericellopsis atlantica]
MSLKRSASPDIIANPFVKKRNLEWTVSVLDNDQPPPPASASPKDQEEPTTAGVESGAESTSNHLEIFSKAIATHARPGIPTLSIESYRSLYTSNAGSPVGAHFVIHQHDHPIAGTHYDLRLQTNETSSVSWAIMYGLPGDVNSTRLNRNATETRIHCLWNHLIETASSQTGSLLIWDTGTYTVLPRRSKHEPRVDPSSPRASPQSPSPHRTQQQLLHEAFQNRKIRLQLHGARLPQSYVINLRLTKSEDEAGRARKPSVRRRRRGDHSKTASRQPVETSDDNDSDSEDGNLVPKGEEAREDISAMEREIREMEDEEVRRTNAYTGAANTIGSVHQRRWYLSLDRRACGFKPGNGRRWVADAVEQESEGEADACRLRYPFYVRGAEAERSIVSGRTGADVLADEGVKDFVQRKGWNAVVT